MYRAYITNNYFFLDVPGATGPPLQDGKGRVVIRLIDEATNEFSIFSPLLGQHNVLLTNLKKEDSSDYTLPEWNTFYKTNTGSFSSSLGGGNGIPTEDHIFTDAASRDAYFNTPDPHLDELITGTPIFVGNVTLPSGSTGTVVQEWGGQSSPASYDNTEWINGSTIGLTAAQIKSLYESNPDTNALTDALLTKLINVKLYPSLTETATEIVSIKSIRTPGESLTLGALKLSQSGLTLRLSDESSDKLYFPIVSELEDAGSLVPQFINFAESVDLPAIADQSEIFTGTSIQFEFPSLLPGIVNMFTFVSTVNTSDINIIIRTGSHINPIPAFDYQRDIGGFVDFVIGDNTFNVPLYFSSGIDLFVTLTSTNNLSLRGEKIGSDEIPHFVVNGRIAQLENLATENFVNDNNHHPTTVRRDMPSSEDATNLVNASLNNNSAHWLVANNQLETSNRADATIRALVSGLLDLDGNEIPIVNTPANTIQLRAGTEVRIFGADEYRIISTPVNLITGVTASQVTQSSTDQNGLINGSPNVQIALDRIDGTGLGAQIVSFTGSFIATHGEFGNQAIWYGGKQSIILEGASGQTNARRTFRLPEPDGLIFVFDDLESKGLGQVFTITIGYLGGSSNSISRNSLTIQTANVSNLFDPNELPTTIASGSSVTFRISRAGGVIGRWERISSQESPSSIDTFGDLEFQTTPFQNKNDEFLPRASQVQKGYAFKVINSTPNDGTLRQGLVDSGVTDKVIYDGDYVVWDADSFTSWLDGGNWFVLAAHTVYRLSLAANNFLLSVSENDNKIDLGRAVENGITTSNIWLSPYVLTEAPFISANSDPDNPRSPETERYQGGTDRVTSQSDFQFGSNFFGSYLYVGLTPAQLTEIGLSHFDVVFMDFDGQELQRFSLEDDFTELDDATFGNGTYRHFVYNTSGDPLSATTVNYSSLSLINLIRTEVQRHFSIDPNTTDLTPNVRNLQENQLSPELVGKINTTVNIVPFDENSIDNRISPLRNDSMLTKNANARFLNSTGTDNFPLLAAMTQVNPDNPVFTVTGTHVFIAAISDNVMKIVLNTTSGGAPVELSSSFASSDPNLEIGESFTVDGDSYFVYRLSGLNASDILEVNDVYLTQVVAWQEDIDNALAGIDRIDAELKHALLNLSDEVINVFENEITVDEQATPTVVASDYNLSLGVVGVQTVFKESSPIAASGGLKDSKPINETTGDRARRKLIYIPEGEVYSNQNYVIAFDGASSTDLIDYSEGIFNVKVLVPAVSPSTITATLYPAPNNLVSGAGIWQTIQALTFNNGIPVPEADELFFTRNIPSSARTLDIQYRGHANGNIFGTNTTTLAGVGGDSEVSTTVVLDDGGETATVEIRWYPSTKRIRVTVVESVHTGLPTINDVEVILSYNETRTVPGTSDTTRLVQISSLSEQGQIFAIKPSSTNTLIIVGEEREVDTGYLYTDLFGATESGNLTVTSNNAEFFDYENYNIPSSGIVDLENHATLPNFGLFKVQYNHETILQLATQLTALDSAGTVLNVGDVLTDLLNRVTALEV